MRQYSLRTLLGVSLLFLVILPAALLAWLLMQRDPHAVEDVASRSLTIAAAQAQRNIENYLMQAHQALDGLMPANASTTSTAQALSWISDPALFAPMAIALTRSFKDLRFVYFRSENGNVHGVENAADGIRFSNRGAVDNGARSALVISADAPLKSLNGIGESPDPRGLSWQDALANADKRSFSAPLVYPASKQLVVTLTQSVVGAAGLVAGVLGADLSLQALPALLQALPHSSGSVFFLTDEKGRMLASTADSAAGGTQGAQWLLRSAGDSRSPLVRASFAALQAQFTTVLESKAAASLQTVRLMSKEGPLFATYIPVGRNFGLQWTLVVAAPEADFSAPLSQVPSLAMATLVFLVLASTALALGGGRYLKCQLARLRRTIDRLLEGEKPSLKTLTSVCEINAVDSSLRRFALKINENRSDAVVEALVFPDSSDAEAQDVRSLRSRLAARSRELAAARDRAKVAERSKTAFLAVISHELRTPLNGVVGMSALLADTPFGAEQRDYLQSLGVACNQLQKVVEDILEYSRIESGEILLQNIAFDVLEVVQEACSLPAKAAQAKGLKLVVDVKGESPSHDGSNAPWLVQGDPKRLAQVISELVVNAVKFTDSGSVIVRVRPLRSLDSAEVAMLDVQVIDTGPGIADEAGDVFAAFTQLDSSMSRRHGGTGLGLATCKRLVELMGGQLAVESDKGKGATFRFTVLSPRAESSALHSAWLAREQAGLPAVFQDTAPEKAGILVVDDHPINLKIACTMLLRLGYQVLSAEGGAEAIAVVAASIASGKPLAAVVMDVHMPDLDGIEATRKILAAHGALAPPIIALTAASSADDCERCLNAGMVDYLTKPLQITALVKSLEKWVVRPGHAAAPSASWKEIGSISLLKTASDAPAQVSEAIHARLAESSAAPVATFAPDPLTNSTEHRHIAHSGSGETGRVSAPAPLFDHYNEAGRSMPMELVDFYRLNDFKEFDDPQLSMTREVIELLFNEVPLQLAAIDRAILEGDAACLSAAAHSLRGAASNVGAVTVQHLSSVLERSTLELQAVPGDAGEWLIALRIAWNQTRPLLENWH